MRKWLAAAALLVSGTAPGFAADSGLYLAADVGLAQYSNLDQAPDPGPGYGLSSGMLL